MVGEELTVAAMGSNPKSEARANLEKELALETLLGREINALSGGEAVRVALSSVAAQGIEELHIDTSLEQLDEHWRRFIFSMLARPTGPIAKQLFIADNHLSQDELDTFDDAIQFPINKEKNDRWSQVIDPTAAAALVCAGSAATILIDNLSFSYNRSSQNILHRVSLIMEPGVLYFLSGDNGSGKTTFVKLLCGTLLPRKGIIYFGSDKFRPAKSPDRFAGVAFQNPDFQWTTQTVEGELQDGQGIINQPSNLQSLLPTFGISEKLFQAHPNELPFVLKKRLGIALALLAGKPWLIFDEPTLGQDQRFQVALAEFIRLVLTQGAGVIMISHDTYFRSLFSKSKRLLFRNQTIVNLWNKLPSIDIIQCAYASRRIHLDRA